MALASAALISVEEYLKTTTDRDCEYVAGVVEERAVGEFRSCNLGRHRW